MVIVTEEGKYDGKFSQINVTWTQMEWKASCKNDRL